MKANQKKAYIFGLSAICLWSTVASACKISLRYLTPAEMVFYSSVTSCLLLAAVLGLQSQLHVIRNMKVTDWIWSAKLAFLNPLAYYLILFKAYDLLPAQQAQPINYTWAITLSLLSVPMLGHRLTRQQGIAILVSYFGVLVISTGGNLLKLQITSPLGVFLALLSTVFWALYWIANTKDERPAAVGLFMNFVCAVPGILIYLALYEGFRMVDVRGLLGAVYLGFFEMGIAFLLWLTAMKYAENTAKLANLIFLSPFMSLVLIYFIVGEKIVPATIIGLIFIVAGLILQGRTKV